MTLEELFANLSKNGQMKVVEAVKAKLLQLAPRNVGLRKYAASVGLEHSWVRLSDTSVSIQERARHWAKISRRLRLSPPFDSVPRPWNRLSPGDTIVICMGQRLVSLKELGDDVKQRVVGARDVEALAILLRFIHRTLDVDCHVRIENVPVHLAYDSRVSWLEGMRKDRSCGAIIVIGSPIVNRLADPMGRAILEGAEEGVDLPGRFRWSFDLDDDASFLSETARCAPEDEGIRVWGDEETTYPRVRDDIIAEEIARNGRTVFADCGMLLCGLPPRGPFLALAAGHGGCGTIGAVLALCEQVEMAEKFAESDVDPTFGQGRVCELIEVRREKKSRQIIDDLEISEKMHVAGHFRSGWRFAVAPEENELDLKPGRHSKKAAPAQADAQRRTASTIRKTQSP